MAYMEKEDSNLTDSTSALESSGDWFMRQIDDIIARGADRQGVASPPEALDVKFKNSPLLFLFHGVRRFFTKEDLAKDDLAKKFCC